VSELLGHGWFGHAAAGSSAPRPTVGLACAASGGVAMVAAGDTGLLGVVRSVGEAGLACTTAAARCLPTARLGSSAQPVVSRSEGAGWRRSLVARLAWSCL
jgi:hypothetical protein